MAIDINHDYSKHKGSTEAHNKLKKEFTIMVSRTFDDVVVIPYDVGFFRAWSNPDIPVRCGLEGVPDLIVFGRGWYLMFDAKTGKNKFQDNQKAFAGRLREINKKHVVYKLTTIKRGLEIIKNEKEGKK